MRSRSVVDARGPVPALKWSPCATAAPTDQACLETDGRLNVIGEV
jgi:hypothetical protein